MRLRSWGEGRGHFYKSNNRLNHLNGDHGADGDYGLSDTHHLNGDHGKTVATV
jgi:hypothetical protein